MEGLVNSPHRGKTRNQYEVLTDAAEGEKRAVKDGKDGKDDKPNDGRVSFDESAQRPTANGASSSGWKEMLKKQKEKMKSKKPTTIEEQAQHNKELYKRIEEAMANPPPMDETMKEAMNQVTEEQMEMMRREECKERADRRTPPRTPPAPHRKITTPTTDRRNKLKEMHALSERSNKAKESNVRWVTTVRMEIKGGLGEEVETSAVVQKVKETWKAIWRADGYAMFQSLVNEELVVRREDEFPEEKEDAEKFFGIDKPVEESQLVTVNNKTGSKTSIGFIIECKFRMWEIKRDKLLMMWLQENNVYLFEHKCKTITVQPIGWFSSRATRQFEADQAEIDLLEVLTEYTKTADKDKWEGAVPPVPKFEMAVTEVRYTHQNKDKKSYRMECRAVEIRCEAKSKTTLKRMLQDADLPERTFGFFVPYGVPESEEYRALINEQNEFLNADFPIFIFGLHESVLDSKMLCPETERMVTMKQRLLEAKYDRKEGEGKNMVPIINAINKVRASDTIGKWAIRTTVAAAEEAHKLVKELIEIGNKTIEHAMVVKERGGEFARGIRLTYHPDASKYKEKVKDRVGNGIENMHIIVTNQRERNQQQYVAAWKSPLANPKSYSQAAQTTTSGGEQRNVSGGRTATQSDNNTVSTLGGGAHSGSQEATIISMAASIEGLQASFQQQEERSNKMESLIAALMDENKKLKANLRKSDEENKQAMATMSKSHAKNTEDIKTHNENMLAALFTTHKKDIDRIEERQLKKQSEADKKLATTSVQVDRMLQMMLEDRALARDSPARKRRVQATDQTEAYAMEDDDTEDWNNTTQHGNETKLIRQAEIRNSPPRIERQTGTYHSIEQYADGEEIRFIENAEGLIIPETLPSGYGPDDNDANTDTEHKKASEPMSWADECESDDDTEDHEGQSRAAENTRLQPLDGNREASRRERSSGGPQDKW
jgi:hypothetical protein